MEPMPGASGVVQADMPIEALTPATAAKPRGHEACRHKSRRPILMPSSNDKTPASHAGDWGLTPQGVTTDSSRVVSKKPGNTYGSSTVPIGRPVSFNGQDAPNIRRRCGSESHYGRSHQCTKYGNLKTWGNIHAEHHGIQCYCSPVKQGAYEPGPRAHGWETRGLTRLWTISAVG